ncbi:DUF2550 family protein [Thermoactinospora rubra]|uniref:DUF2550 family protein n=1 Tax=Thermoactinospora rubra TaxID=1088767 RepID=UPI000A110876|nr:DUF2550 family protein [Thermoactinospora rubra]
MGAALTILSICLVLLLLVALRRFLISRASVPCRLSAGTRGWRSGVARYSAGELHWIPLWGVRLRPRHAIARRGLTVSARRRIEGGLWAVDCGEVSLAMSEDAMTGFLAWLESAPPSSHLDPSPHR